MIRFLDLQAVYAELRDEIDAAVAEVVAGGWYIGGPAVERFEQNFAAACGAAHCVGTGNGLDALILALRACGVGAGDEVIVPSHTFIATWLAVSAVGAKVVPVEPDADSYLIDPTRIEAAITPRTRAILPVHLYGQVCDMDAIGAIAQRHRLRVIVDAAQAHGARYKGRPAGADGDISCWSFYPGKNLGAMGDAGAITTNDAALADAVRRLGNYGSSRKYVHDIEGVNSRLDPLQAAILDAKLPFLDRWNDRRRAIAAFYSEELRGVNSIATPASPDFSDSSWHLYVVRTADRQALAGALAERGVETVIHYPSAVHNQQAYRHLGFTDADFPLAARLAAEVISLPIGPHLSREQAAHVVDAVTASLAVTAAS